MAGGSDLKRRLKTFSIFFPTAMFLLSKPVCVMILVAILSQFGYRELTVLFSNNGGSSPRPPMQVVALTFPIMAYLYGMDGLSAVLVCSVASAFLCELCFGEDEMGPQVFHRVLLESFAQLYCCWSMSHGVLLTTGFAFTLVLCTSNSEHGALFAGKLFGKHKISFLQRVSPNKSVEGFLGSIAFSVITAVCLHASSSYFTTLPQMDLSLYTALGVLIGLLAIFGDLCESLIKRCFAVKDVGNTLPGWGGFLDRIDSFIFTLPLGYYFSQIVMGAADLG